ncbi:uncharacterized protein LOC110992318 [Pieris rapae]|uniref:uncharacterized protein LOC110992318 n=1 Tax=Pieris rapae TaxID=64459 RepID=UPI000B929019|nr:uncharacterized protein LOC110992318 [Pieris rapae]
MKPEEMQSEEKVTGDVIGDTAYSERFVLKILLKLANLDTLKDEILDQAFEEDLCTLWDMTAERDVVLFLLQHDVINLLSFAWPIIETPRIAEIMVGIIANMCCQKEAVINLLKLMPFVKSLVECIKGNDSLILIQLLRLINSSLFLASNDNIQIWLRLFIEVGYSKHLYFILKNSSQKDLLINALENLNTICTYCNIEALWSDFFGHFVSAEALESVIVGYIEITETHRDLCEKEQFERILLISIQIILNLVGFDKSVSIFNDNKNDALKMITITFQYYENKLVNCKEIDMDLVDIVDSTISVINALKINEISELDDYFMQSYKMWKTLHYMVDSQQVTENDHEDLVNVSKELQTSLSTLMFVYMEKCNEDNILRALDEINEDFDDVASFIENKCILNLVTERVSTYRTRLKEIVDC